MTQPIPGYDADSPIPGFTPDEHGKLPAPPVVSPTDEDRLRKATLERELAAVTERVAPSNKCPQCGQPGAHFVPPCFGETGFFSCDPNDRPKPSRTPENYTMPCSGCFNPILPGDKWVGLDRWTYVHERCAPDFKPDNELDLFGGDLDDIGGGERIELDTKVIEAQDHPQLHAKIVDLLRDGLVELPAAQIQDVKPAAQPTTHSFRDMALTTGVFWWINSFLHPQGYHLSLIFNAAGECTGWQLRGDSRHLWQDDAMYARLEFAKLRAFLDALPPLS